MEDRRSVRPTRRKSRGSPRAELLRLGKFAEGDCARRCSYLYFYADDYASHSSSAVAQAVLVIIDDCRIPNTIDVGGMAQIWKSSLAFLFWCG